ncbi:hypothetical protein C8R45DRAFT_990558 [Mycena sanguinolenta]|nr:hypothetical protein C8R45DRAFT_990558 [Mycena sanguinolenta]
MQHDNLVEPCVSPPQRGDPTPANPCRRRFRAQYTPARESLSNQCNMMRFPMCMSDNDGSYACHGHTVSPIAVLVYLSLGVDPHPTSSLTRAPAPISLCSSSRDQSATSTLGQPIFISRLPARRSAPLRPFQPHHHVRLHIALRDIDSYVSDGVLRCRACLNSITRCVRTMRERGVFNASSPPKPSRCLRKQNPLLPLCRRVEMRRCVWGA